MPMKRCSKLLVEKCKSKLQWDITLHQSEWLSSENPQTTNEEKVWRIGKWLFEGNEGYFIVTMHFIGDQSWSLKHIQTIDLPVRLIFGTLIFYAVKNCV